MRVLSREAAARLAGAIGRLPVVAGVIRHPPLRRLLEKVPGAHALYGNGWDRVHPFDRAHGTDTSGCVAAAELPAGEAARAHAICYAGSQPSVLRQGLAELWPLDSFAFVDLGCGKGRALLVASELPFREILGVELSAPLARIASRNAVLIARRFPKRTAIAVAVADASTFPLPAGNLVLFLYHPFSAALVARVAASVDAALASQRRCVYVVYYNPVAGHCFDASKRLRRRYARVLPYAAEERGYGPDDADTLVIWQGGTQAPPAAAANARIVKAPGGLRAVLESS
jgi:SAM-dependent methyltransferase